MRNQVFFRTRLFENKEPKANFINPRCFGEDIVSWLLKKLEGAGLALGGPIQEDYGWGFWVETDYWVSVGVMDDSIGMDEPEWLISFDFKAGIKKLFFRKADPSVQQRISEGLHSVLQDEPAITNIRWCNLDETDCGDNPR